MDRQKELQHIKEEYQNLFEAVQNLSRYIDKMESAISTSEPQEPETWEEIFHSIEPKKLIECGWSCTTDEQVKQIEQFAKRLLIADYCGRREFIEDQENWTIEILDSKPDAACFKQIRYPETNYFPTKEAAEKYLRICQNSNLL